MPLILSTNASAIFLLLFTEIISLCSDINMKHKYPVDKVRNSLVMKQAVRTVATAL
jgi:hypothetical protein